MILFEDKKDCCGCEACANACPMGIITMQADGESFLYPRIDNADKCIGCRRCEQVCPMKHIEKQTNFQEQAYAGYADTDEEIFSCASGGLASAMSRGVVSHGGVVYGVRYSSDCQNVLYARASSVEQLEAFKTSKYVQARKNFVYQEVQSDLQKDCVVLFVGLPCECYALQLFLKKRYEQLYVCALMCHGPTSPAVHTKYYQYLQNEHRGALTAFSVRYKKDGWKPYYIRSVYQDGTELMEKFDSSNYGKAFLYMKRPSCNVCQIKRSAIHSDITIGDYHLAARGNVKPYNKFGVSSCIVHTEKGEKLLHQMDGFHIQPVTIKNVLYSDAYYRAIPKRANRDEFGKVFSSKGLQAACALKSIDRIEHRLKIKRSLLCFASKIKKALLLCIKHK